MKDDTTDNDKGSIKPNKYDTSAHTQRLQILALLRVNSLNTLELRAKNHMAPAPRVLELRTQGYKIITVREDVRDSGGLLHKRVARYTLLSEPSPANNDMEEKVA